MHNHRGKRELEIVGGKGFRLYDECDESQYTHGILARLIIGDVLARLFLEERLELADVLRRQLDHREKSE